MVDLTAHFTGVRSNGSGWTAICPGHADQHNSLSIHHRDGRWLLKCHAGCDWRDIIAPLGLDAAALFDDENRDGRMRAPSNNRATAQPRMKQPATGNSPRLRQENRSSVDSGSPGVTLEQYADAKALPLDFLKACGLSEFTRDRKPALRIP